MSMMRLFSPEGVSFWVEASAIVAVVPDDGSGDAYGMGAPDGSVIVVPTLPVTKVKETPAEVLSLITRHTKP